MHDFDKVTMPKDLEWFAHRYNSLLVPFPNNINEDVLASEPLCEFYDPAEALSALKHAHGFLVAIAGELKHGDDRKAAIERTFLKLDMLWGVAYYGNIGKSANNYYLRFTKKQLKSGGSSLPKSYPAAFDVITENGCFTEYFADDKPAAAFSKCDSGILYFNDALIALGLHLYVRKVTEKRWYSATDNAGTYSDINAYNPVKHCVEPYNRVDMRVFTCDNRLAFDVSELLGGYDKQKRDIFTEVNDYINVKYAECVPKYHGLFNYICSSVNYMINPKHAMLCALGLGQKNIGMYCALTPALRMKAETVLDGLRGDWYDITNESDVEYTKRLIDFKAKYGKNIFSSKNQ